MTPEVFATDPLGVDIVTPDLGAVALACGWRVDNPQDLADLPGMLRRASMEVGLTMILFGDGLREEAQSKAPEEESHRDQPQTKAAQLN